MDTTNLPITERVAILENDMRRLMGNGQPGIIHAMWDRLESNNKLLQRGMGAMIAIQAAIGGLIALVAAGVIKIK